MVTAKAIFCIWTGIFMVLPGCLCQVLEPLGIHVPHHHHHRDAGIVRSSGQPREVVPAQMPEPMVPCHCDKRPDRTSDECVALIAEMDGLPAQVLSDAQRVSLPRCCLSNTVPHSTSRGPPVRCSATMRSLLCVYVV